MIYKLIQHFKSESGSAVVEFVALAIPLFLPIFIYLNHFSSLSVNEEIARSMAREVLRVFVISENDQEGRELSNKATKMLAQHWNLSISEISSIRVDMDCSNNPCRSANGRIKVTISFSDEKTGRLVTASAQEHLSPWL